MEVAEEMFAVEEQVQPTVVVIICDGDAAEALAFQAQLGGHVFEDKAFVAGQISAPGVKVQLGFLGEVNLVQGFFRFDVISLAGSAFDEAVQVGSGGGQGVGSIV